MKSLKTYSLIMLVAATLLTVSCKEKGILSFGGKMDKFSASDENGSKTYLGHAEQWIYWETNDDIKVYAGGDDAKCTLVSGNGSLNAFFQSNKELPEGTDFYAIYPYSSGGASYTSLTFPATQPYREAGTPTGQDSSFGRGALPMVAYRSGSTDSAIYFHAVAGILRLQFYGRDLTKINSILFEEVSPTPKQISGPFYVHDIDKNMPYLTATAAGTAANCKIEITNIGKKIGPDSLLTFYLPLPAVDGPSTKTNYRLKMTITAEGGKYCTKTLGADIHRRNITKMQALYIQEWDTKPTGTDALTDIHLVGSGTKDRPFQIYSGYELDLVRQAFSAAGGGTVTINGQPVVNVPASGVTDNATHFKIVRSDIVLLSPSAYSALTPAEQENPRFVRWTEGIPNFKGYMYFASSTATNGGITNESDAPLFESIAENAIVDRVYVKGTSTPTVLPGRSFSPMCNVNNGTMIECHNKCAVTISVNANLAGLCATNNGKILGGANEAQLNTNGNVAGICYNNSSTGYIQGSFTLSVAVPQGANIGGICYNNNGTVEDCQVSSNTPITSTGNWGILVFNNNSGAVINNCISTGALVYTINGSVGGICHTNNGTVKNCTNDVEIRASQGNVGGVVAYMNNATAEIYNCRTTAPFIYGVVNSNAATNCGGIIGELLLGKVYNCYNRSSVTGATNSGGMVGHLANDPYADVQGSWSAQGHNFVGLYDDGAHVNQYCFSATIAAAATYCNRIAKDIIVVEGQTYNPFEIVKMHTHSGEGFDQTLNGSVNPDTLRHKHCGVALNNWVDYRSSIGDTRTYFRWTTTANQPPVFITGMPNQGKGRRKR